MQHEGMLANTMVTRSLRTPSAVTLTAIAHRCDLQSYTVIRRTHHIDDKQPNDPVIAAVCKSLYGTTLVQNESIYNLSASHQHRQATYWLFITNIFTQTNAHSHLQFP